MEIKEIKSADELEKAVGLIEKTFFEFDASYYSEKGIKAFCDFIHDSENFKETTFFGAYAEDTLAGVLAMDYARSHIMCFFVDGAYHRKGIGKALFRHMLCGAGQSDHVSVNAAPYATEIYHRLGFVDTAPMQEDDGIIYTPMRYFIR